MMAQAGRDPIFWAAVDIANQDDEEHLGNVGVGDLCLRCHVPTAWYEGRSTCTTAWGQRFDGSCLRVDFVEENDDFEGISCAFCHRMYDASDPPPGDFLDPAAPYAGNARIYLSKSWDTMRGPFSDSMPEWHEVADSALHRSSALCGQCHDVTNPAKNRRDPITGADLGYPMPIERTYSEWRESAHADPASSVAATCMDCHMPEPDLDGDGTPDDAFACLLVSDPRGRATALEGPMRKHSLTGPNSWMLSVLNAEYGPALGREELFLDAIAASIDLITNRTAEVSSSAPATVVAGNSFDADVRVTNLAGHKFPTGYPEGRRSWLQVAAGEDRDGDGVLSVAEIEFESGAYDAATGVLTRDGQVKVYEHQLGVWDFNGTGACDRVDAAGEELFHFVLNDCIVQDNRIPPLGFVPGVETAPVGVTYPDNPALPGTLANWDDTRYSIPVPDTALEPYLVEVTLLYQSTSREYVEFLRDESRSTCDPFDEGCDPTLPDAGLNRGEKMHDLWSAYDRAPPLPAGFARSVIAVEPAPTGACCVGETCFELSAPACGRQGGDYRGDGVPCASVTCAPVVGPPPGEAAHVAVGAAPLLVTGRDAATGELDLSFGLACDATDHALLVGPLADVSTHAYGELTCALGLTGTRRFDPGPGDVFFLIVGRSSTVEGSYGRDSLGDERPESVGLAPCDFAQDLTATCD